MRVLAAALAFVLAVPVVMAAPTWQSVHISSYAFLMPPKECRAGPVPPYEVIVVPQADLDIALPRKLRKKGIHLFAEHDIGVDGPIIYISAALPHRPAVYQAVFQHELAHLRGCEHGNITPKET